MFANQFNRVTWLADKFREFYEKSDTPYFTKNEVLEKLSDGEIAQFLEAINLPGLLNTIPSLYLSTALTSPTKYNFGIYLLTRFPFELKVNEPDTKGRSLFQTLVSCRDTIGPWSLADCLTALYSRGYQNKEGDLDFLSKTYKEGIHSEDQFENWCLCRFAYLIQDGAQLRMAFSNPKILFTILSFKQNRPIGINYPNLLGVANSALQHYREVGDIILHAMKHYKVYDEIANRDKKGNFKLKLEDYLKYKPIQNSEYDEVIYKVFPELKPGTNVIANQPQ